MTNRQDTLHPSVDRLSEYFDVPVAVHLARPFVLVTHGNLPSVPASNGQRLCPPNAKVFADDIVATDILAPAVLRPEHTGTGVKIMYEVVDDDGTPTGVGELIVPGDMILGITVLWDTRKPVLAQPAAPKILLK
jgi:hypothetical protein